MNKEFENISHGIYTKKDSGIDELFILHQRCPNAVFSHDEAFYYHGLTEREPLVPTLTVYSGYNTHRLTMNGKCKVYTVKKNYISRKDKELNRLMEYAKQFRVQNIPYESTMESIESLFTTILENC